MANIYSIPLSDIVSEFNLDFFYKSSDFDKIHVTVDEVSRPGLHLAGFFDHFEPMRNDVCAASGSFSRSSIPASRALHTASSLKFMATSETNLLKI